MDGTVDPIGEVGFDPVGVLFHGDRLLGMESKGHLIDIVESEVSIGLVMIEVPQHLVVVSDESGPQTPDHLGL